ncbi:hypothetical protein D9758_013054 [Tetrapyrgos nigripes]|uniref:DUF6589 domain-containing protein n=1 Tax=Tetrapyrgos nigripes TaxID=182062 RepID=A0A8H5CS71_9AGAR|nr:hypothetical protein D9758_013054 [Tetrapyrgos nigripes]
MTCHDIFCCAGCTTAASISNVTCSEAHFPNKKNPADSVDWQKFGVSTFQHITELHQKHQALLWGLLETISWPESNIECKNRPVEVVISTTISKLVFSHSLYTHFRPLQEALFNITANVSFKKFRYDSHVGNTPSYPTSLKALLYLSERAAIICWEYRLDPGFWFFIVLDNVQNYIHQRPLCMLHQNWMNLGMAGTMWIKLFGAEVDSSSSSTGTMNSMSSHSSGYGFLVRQGLRQKVPDALSLCFPLPTTRGSETQLNEFLASSLDFFKSCSQTGDCFHRQILLVGGDGFTFELLWKLKEHHQLHKSPFHGLKIMSPVLAWWHTGWTNDTHLVDNHLVNYASLDPSTLSHSASKINRKLSKEQGKYNYHQALELMYLVADMRMLDCWRLLLMCVTKEQGLDVSDCKDVFNIVEVLWVASKVPNTPQFERYAYKLHDLYTTKEAIYRCAHGMEDSQIPTASPSSSASSPPQSSPSFMAATLSSSESSSPLPPSQTSMSSSRVLQVLDEVWTPPQPNPTPVGDNVLTRSKDFMWEALHSQEIVWSIAEGDVG